MNRTGGLIFISCGQFTTAEKELGQAVCGLVRDLTPHRPYFAENQSSLEGVTKNILSALDEAVGLIAIMHYRGNVMSLDSEVLAFPPRREEHARASLWIEQEIGIAAYIRQVLNRKLEVIAYIQKGIQREGLRDKIHLNARTFGTDDEVLADLEKFLPQWKELPATLKAPAVPDIQVKWIEPSVGNCLFHFQNNEQTTVFVREIILTHNRIRLTEPIKPTPPTEWKMNPGCGHSFGKQLFGQTNPGAMLVAMCDDGRHFFRTNVDVLVRYEINAELREVSHTFSVGVNRATKQMDGTILG